MRTTTLIAAALASLPAGLAAQQEASGSITGTMGLDSATWYVKGQGHDPGSAWRDTDEGRVVQLAGYPEQEPEGTGGALVIEFVATGNRSELAVSAPQVSYIPENEETRYVADEVNVDLSLTALAVQGDELALSGSFVAAMTPGGTEELVVDGEQDLTVDGNFQATIYRSGD